MSRLATLLPLFPVFLSAGLAIALGFASVMVFVASARGADAPLTDPYLGQPDAIAAGEQIYRSKCYICHGNAGGRGPNLFQTKLSDERFLETVINGRKDTLMPAFGLRLTPDDVWKVHAFLKANPGGI
ncbi:MAG: c-type cytochrome [Pseudomonadota bacterium]